MVATCNNLNFTMLDTIVALHGRNRKYWRSLRHLCVTIDNINQQAVHLPLSRCQNELTMFAKVAVI